MIWECRDQVPELNVWVFFFPYNLWVVSELKEIPIVECMNPFWRVSSPCLDSSKLGESDRKNEAMYLLVSYSVQRGELWGARRGR